MTSSTDGFHAEWLTGASAVRVRREEEVAESGIALPLRARVAWAPVQPWVRSSLLVVEAGNGARAAAGVEAHPSRALPGHVIWRIPRVGGPISADAARALVSAIIAAAHRDPRVLRVHVDAFSRDERLRKVLGAQLSDQGFTPIASTISYEYTLAADLGGMTNEEHLAALAQGVRQNIKAIAKFPVRLDVIRDVRESPRMNELMRETLARTGAHHVQQDYAPIIRLAAEAPNLARLVGLYKAGESRPAALIALALGVNNGDHVAYDIGASARIDELRQLSMGYPLLWDLIVWARGQRVSWFDFGGVSVQTADDQDPLARISDFKRRFTKDVVRVGEEWVWTPRPVRDHLARSLARGAAVVKRLGSARGQ